MVEQTKRVMSRHLMEMSGDTDAGSALNLQAWPGSLRQNADGASQLQKS